MVTNIASVKSNFNNAFKTRGPFGGNSKCMDIHTLNGIEIIKVDEFDFVSSRSCQPVPRLLQKLNEGLALANNEV